LELTKANEKLKLINDAKSEFISLAAHQLRTPITTMRWYAEILISDGVGELNEKQRKYIQNIHLSAKKISGLINTLLYISRLELGSNTTKYSLFDIKDVFEGVHSDYKTKLKDKKIKLLYNKLNNVFLYQDISLIEIIIQNLLSNAIKYTPNNGTIKCETEIVENSLNSDSSMTNKNLLVKISDSGYGIPKDQQRKIFTKLYRGKNIINKKIEGVGLGLYLVKLIVDKINGKIWFESELDAIDQIQVSDF